jgi:hypothetical protein
MFRLQVFQNLVQDISVCDTVLIKEGSTVKPV